MEFEEIKNDIKAYPGEFLLYKPTNQIVVCGAFKVKEGTIKAMSNGQLIEDKIHNFRKIQVRRAEWKKNKSRRSCGGCKK
jgi:hypothetical protein